MENTVPEQHRHRRTDEDENDKENMYSCSSRFTITWNADEMRDSNAVVEDEVGDECDDAEEEEEEEESDADYRARMMHVDTFLRLNDSISSLKQMGEKNPAYALQMQQILRSSVNGVPGSVDPEPVKPRPTPPNAPSPSAKCTATVSVARGGDGAGRTDDPVTVKAHAHLIYHGDLLQLSKETITLSVSKRDMGLFTRIIECFKRMILGQHTDEDVARMRRDHDLLIAMWDSNDRAAGGSGGGGSNETAGNNTGNIGCEIKNMLRCMLETPLYYTNSCMALIACGQMLRNLYTVTEGRPVETYEQLIAFVRKNMRHNPADPFECNCGTEDDDDENGGGPCSQECKTLMSMIMEIPPIVHNQTYLLQVLAYLVYDNAGREEVFINNLKNTCSPGLLDKVPTRLAMLMGTLDETEIRRNYKAIRKQVQHLNPLKDRSIYNKNALERLVHLVHDPRVQALIDVLPGASAVTVELTLPKCSSEKTKCLNRDFDEKAISRRELNNNGKNKCCGYLRQDPFDILISSISLAQLLVYTFTDPRSAPPKSRTHFFVRDIIKSMARQTVKIKVDTLEEMFCYLDRTRVFKGFNEHPFMMTALQELLTSYIDYMKEAAEKYKETGKKRRMKRYLKKNGVPEGGV